MSEHIFDCYVGPLLVGVTPRTIIVALFVFTLVKVARVRDAAKSHTLWVTVLCGMLAYQFIALAVPLVFIPLWGDFTRTPDGSMRAAPWLRAVAAVYLVGVVVMLLRLGRDLLLSRRFVNNCEPIRDARVQRYLTELSPHPTVRGRPSVWTCASSRVPLTLGYFRPKIILPPDWRHWGEQKLKAVLAHEVAHVKRGDHLVQLLGVINQCVYWFHPLTWVLQKRMSLLAEEACDAAAARFIGDRRRYAKYLLEVASNVDARQGRLVLSGLNMAQATQMHSRVEALLDTDRELSSSFSSPQKLAVALLALGLWAFVVSLCFSH